MIVLNVGKRVLMDREALAQWAERSVHTVRRRCPVFRYAAGVALYDAHACADLLDSVPARRRVAA